MYLFQAMEQFKVINYNLLNIMIPNYIISLLSLIIFYLIVTFLTNIKNIMFLSKSFVQVIFEELYIFILNVIKQNIVR